MTIQVPKQARMLLGGAIALALLSPATAGVLPFGVIDDFESQVVGTTPAEFHDSDSGDPTYFGTVEVRPSGFDGVLTIPGLGGSQFSKITPGPPGSFDTGVSRVGPFGHIGSGVPFPSTSDQQYAIFTDIFTNAADPGDSGFFRWANGLNLDSNPVSPPTAGFTITPGEALWSFIATGAGGSPVDLAANAWYTMEVIFDISGANLALSHSIYAQGQRGVGPTLYNFMTTTAVASNDVDGLRFSEFTEWDNDTVDALYIDNIGTAAVPEPASTTLLGLLAAGGLGTYWRRNRRRVRA